MRYHFERVIPLVRICENITWDEELNALTFTYEAELEVEPCHKKFNYKEPREIENITDERRLATELFDFIRSNHLHITGQNYAIIIDELSRQEGVYFTSDDFYCSFIEELAADYAESLMQRGDR